MSKVLQAIAHLLPTGWAWPRHMQTVLMRMTGALADTEAEFLDFTGRQMEQWRPDRTCSRLEEWEEALGLPDPCLGADQTDEQRRTSVLVRFRGTQVPYDDSSADSPGAIAMYLAEFGYDVEVWYSWPFRVGRNRVGDRLGLLDGVLNVRVPGYCERFRIGLNHVGERLAICKGDGTEITCLLKRVVPSRFAINVVFF